MVCWITPTTWESLILYLNNHLHWFIALLRYGRLERVPRYKPWQRRSLKSSNKSATLPSPKISASLLTVDPIPRCCNHSADSITNPLFFGSPTCDVNTAVTFSASKNSCDKQTGGGWSFLVNLKGFYHIINKTGAADNVSWRNIWPTSLAKRQHALCSTHPRCMAFGSLVLCAAVWAFQSSGATIQAIHEEGKASNTSGLGKHCWTIFCRWDTWNCFSKTWNIADSESDSLPINWCGILVQQKLTWSLLHDWDLATSILSSNPRKPSVSEQSLVDHL